MILSIKPIITLESQNIYDLFKEKIDLLIILHLISNRIKKQKLLIFNNREREILLCLKIFLCYNLITKKSCLMVRLSLRKYENLTEVQIMKRFY